MDPKDSISYASFPEDLRTDIAKNVIEKMKSWLPKAVADLRMLGAERTAPLPVVECKQIKG